MMNYNIPFPDVLYRRSLYLSELYRGKVVAFKYWDGNHSRTGIIVLDGKDWMKVAVNLYEEEGRLWYEDELPDNIELYEASDSEKCWGFRYYLDYQKYEDRMEHKGKHPLIAFIDDEWSGAEHEEWGKTSLTRELLSMAPKLIAENDWSNLKDQLKQSIIQMSGLQFNRYRAEYYCLLMGILMIAEQCKYEYKRQGMIESLLKNWHQFSWMYSIGIGRVFGNRLTNFTAMIRQAGANNRKHYLHLYLPLIEHYIDKICNNGSEKRDKLERAISDMRQVEAREKQFSDLDELYGILFPKYILEALSSHRPAGTIAELEATVVAQEQRIIALKASMKEMTSYYNRMLGQLTKAVREVESQNLSSEAFITAFLQFPTDLALSFFGGISTLLAQNGAWQEMAPGIQQRILQKQQEEQEKRQKVDDALIKVAEKPTTIYMSGATHEDRRFQVIQENKCETNKQLDNKNE
jgi:hypothetical protein